MIEKIVHIEEQAKSNAKRIDEHEEEINNLKRTYAIMEKMDYRMGKVESAVDKIDQKLDAKVNEDSKEKGKKWDKLIDYLFYTILGLLLGFIAFKLGLK